MQTLPHKSRSGTKSIFFLLKRCYLVMATYTLQWTYTVDNTISELFSNFPTQQKSHI